MSDGYCFISYSNGDADGFGPQLANELEGGNPFIETWYDKRDIPAGATWDEKVPEAIKTCKCFIFVMTNDSIAENTICADEWDLALRYKRPILILRLDKDIKEAPFRLGKRQWIDYVGNPRAGIAKLRLAIQRLDSPEGQIDILRDRLADANRDLVRIQEKDEKSRIESEIKELNEEIKATELVKKDPEKARKQTRKNINAGLERDRQPINPVNATTPSKFINPRPGSIPDYFEGRLIETQEIAEFLCNDNQRIMTIIGRAGSGKTVLTCRVLQRLENGEFPNDLGEFKVGGIVYLSEIGNYKINVPNIFSGLLQLLSLEKANKIDAIYREAKKPIDEKIRALLAELPQEPIVLLLDNFEDLLDLENEEIIDQELHTALTTILQADKHNLKVLITTRIVPRQISLTETARQNIKHLEEGLPSPHAENVLRKMDADGQAGLRDATDELLGKVREATSGYPRALEAIFAILRVDRYSNVEELLAEGLPETVVEKYVGEAFSRLDTTKQRIIQTLAIYNRPVSYAAIDFALQFHIPGVSSATILERLVSMHFVRRESKRYFLHPADRDYALSRMPAGDTSKKIGQGARARTWDQYSLTLRAADYFLEARKPLSELKRIDDLAAQFAEFDLRYSANKFDAAANILLDIDFDYLLIWGHYKLIIDLHEKLRGKVQDVNTHLRHLNNMGLGYANIGQISNSIEIYEYGLEIANLNNQHQAEMAILGNLGSAYSSLGKIEKSIELHKKALEISREIDDKRHEGVGLSCIGQEYAKLGKTINAINYSEQGLEISQKVGGLISTTTGFINLGVAYFYLDNQEKAKEYFSLALNQSDKINFMREQFNSRFGLALTNLVEENLDNARIMIESAAMYKKSTKDEIPEPLHGIIALRQGDEVVARGAFLRAIGQADEILSKTAEFYSALDAKGLAICGLALCRSRLQRDDSPNADDLSRFKRDLQDAIETFRKARRIAPHAGIVKSVLRLFDELVKCDTEGILKDVRKVIDVKPLVE